ncbi:hypothetical protein [Lysinibacillus fusiformis]|uniref:hypothetical protein n=1 Tax=Lysinibacillus fusiformis TaxID=28031 RepID=UPI000887E730|nr:hypothetical protein [Lysinibacillus fusiformis]SCX66907.1 hypothetical protein SAMN02787108_03886 [Lysinibacillus fusiformis]SDB41219.1 hypothetical protein SAMN02787070_02973 [Lysinibacillus fusiformis]SFI55435.1 hypothetical protein SAMN02787080_02988 [Lysinibacillus fusiformis]SFT24036.1 hypothetical protein SAMN02787099_03778 [Lysinibacillus fusiformis]
MDREKKFEELSEIITKYMLSAKLDIKMEPIVNNLYILQNNKDIEYINNTEKGYTEKIVKSFEVKLNKTTSGEGSDQEELKNLKNEIEQHEKNILKSVLKTGLLNIVTTSIVLEAFQRLNEEEEELDNNLYYSGFDEFYTDLLKIKSVTKIEKTKEKKYSLYNNLRRNFFLNDISYLNQIFMSEALKLEDFKKINPPIAKALLPYYIYSIYRSSKENTVNVNIKNLFENTIEPGRNKYIYSTQKYENSIKEISGERDYIFKIVDPEKLMIDHKLTNDLPSKVFDISLDDKVTNIFYRKTKREDLIQKLKSISKSELDEIRKLFNFDRNFYYYALRFYDLKTYHQLLVKSRKELGINTSVNLLIMNKFNKLYDAFFLVPILNEKRQLLDDETSLAAIMKIDDFKIKNFLIDTYNLNNCFDYNALIDSIEKLVFNMKDYFINSFEIVFGQKVNDDGNLQILKLAIEYFQELEDEELVKKFRFELRKWSRLDDYCKMDYIENFGNVLILLHKLNRKSKSK